MGAKDRNQALTDQILAEAHRLGFDLVAIAPAMPSTTIGHYRDWLDRGYHGKMDYLARPDAVANRRDPAHILPGLQTLVTVGINYHTEPLLSSLADDPSRGIVASYAWGEDYHDLLAPRLRQLGAFVANRIGLSMTSRAYVDTGPLLEREMAANAGLGFLGKNTNLIHPRLGSWLFLGVLLLTPELPAGVSFGEIDQSQAKGECGQCTRCLDACPTDALIAPGLLDARRCISYLTIELKGPIPRELRPLMGNRIFGCDICQEVCPWNRRFARPNAEPAFQPRSGMIAPRLLDLMALDDDGFRRKFRGSPIKRTRRRGLLRNTAVALGNWGDPGALPALARALQDDEPLIRGHAAWAMGRIDTVEAQQELARALDAEDDGWVREELCQALG